jgi:acetylornithine deacetylase
LQSEIALLRDLVACPSVSGDEEAIAALVETRANGLGLDVVRDDSGVKIAVESGRAGPTVALISHLDVVPPGSGWVRQPFSPVIEGDQLYGRGSSDAKASVAAMILAAADLASSLPSGRLYVVLGHSEETKDTSMGRAVATIPPIDAAIVGEPTNLDFAVAQRGLMMVDLVAQGDQRHAGNVEALGFRSAVTTLARDLVKLPSLLSGRPHPMLGSATVTATMVSAGIGRNVTPPEARAVLDIRSTPAWSHAEIQGELKRAIESQVVITSERLVPCETPPNSRMLAAAREVRPDARVYGSPTCSDWVFVRGADTIKCGPGTSSRSHTADESVHLPEVTGARRFYRDVVRRYLQ